MTGSHPPADSPPPGWTSARIIGRQEWAHGLMTLRLEAEISFEAGQFFNLGLWLSEGLVRRAYSVASAPGEPLEFFMARVDTGEFSPALFELREGDEVLVEQKPQGFFSMRYLPPARDLWLVATGTGLGPFISMLRSGQVWQRFQKCVVVHGVRDSSQLAYRDELGRLAETHPLSLVTCFSRDPEAGGVRGRVTEALTSGSLEAAAGTPLSLESHLMLCGNPQMIQDMVALLKARGLSRHRVRKPGHITIEKYW